MKRGPVLGMVLVVLLLIASPALAQEEEGEGGAGESTTTTMAVPIDPAVTVESPVEDVVVPDWTYRFMVPTALVLAAVVVLLTSIRYFTNVVRKRYRIVDE